MKRVTILSLAMLFAPALLFAQNWDFDSIWPDSATAGGHIHGLAVTSDGNVWVQHYYPFQGDSVYVEQTGDSARVNALYVYKPDGTEASFSPLNIINMKGGGQDTVGGFWNGTALEYRSGRGLEVNADGNVVAAFGNTLFIIDSATGEGIAKVENTVDDGLDHRGLVKPAVDADGNIYVTGVFPDDPLIKYDKDLKNPTVVVDTTGNFSRGIEVSPDGNTIYFAGYPDHALTIYTRPSPFDPFDQTPDTVLKGMQIESIDFHPITKYLWVSAGSPDNPPNLFPDVETHYTQHTWYAFDYATLGTDDEVALDSLNFDISGTGVPGRPRAIAFSPDGKIAYAGQFNQSTDALQKFTTDQVFTSIENNRKSEIPSGYALEQNYPNPFNPTTNINYTINEAGPVTLKVYDMTGREVATLVNTRMTAGNHQVSFDASNLASGVYLYMLQANGVRLTNRMTLIK
jgi:WD40 repeat protein